MFIEPFIRLADQVLVELFLADAALVAADQKDGFTLRIKGKGHPPFAVRRTEAKLLHVGVFRVVQRIGARPLQHGAELLEQLGRPRARPGRPRGTPGTRRRNPQRMKLTKPLPQVHLARRYSVKTI